MLRHQLGVLQFHSFLTLSAVCKLSCVRLSAALWTVACLDPLSMRFPRQDYWSRLPFPPPGDLPFSRMESMTPASPGLAGRFFTAEPPGKSIWPYLPGDNAQSHRLRMQDRSHFTPLQISITSPGCYLYFWLSINQRFPWSTPWVQLVCWNGS